MSGRDAGVRQGNAAGRHREATISKWLKQARGWNTTTGVVELRRLKMISSYCPTPAQLMLPVIRVQHRQRLLIMDTVTHKRMQAIDHRLPVLCADSAGCHTHSNWCAGLLSLWGVKHTLLAFGCILSHPREARVRNLLYPPEAKIESPLNSHRMEVKYWPVLILRMCDRALRERGGRRSIKSYIKQ